MKNVVKNTPAFLLLACFLLFLVFKDPGKPWDRAINSDGKGYYAYLPALFIYHDPAFHFVEHYESLYYPQDKYQFKEFRVHMGSGIIDKYFPGLAVLWLPFFLAAHLLSFLLGFPADGYSILYQWAISLAALFYLWLGLVFLIRLLKRLGAPPETAAFIALLTALGTNLIFFTVIEDSMSHVYSFSMVTIFLYLIVRLFESGNPRWIIPASALFALICIIRPVNGMIILMVPALYTLMKDKRKPFLQNGSFTGSMAGGLSAALLIFAIPIVYWFHQTGHFLVYSYGQERLDFRNPHFLSILFSFNRGWFLYTPIAFISLAGLTGIFRENKKAFYLVLLFLLSFTFISSCWWLWYYASKCGQRVFIDIYAVIAILLFFLIRVVNGFNLLKTGTYVLLLGLTGLNLFQFYQHARFIFPPTDITAGIYRDSFFSFSPKARVYLPDHAISGTKTFFTDMEKSSGWINEYTRNNSNAFSGNYSSLVNRSHPYSIGLDHAFSGDPPDANRMIRISAMILPEHKIDIATLVIDFSEDGKSFSYTPFYLNSFMHPGQWERIEAGIHIPRDLHPDAHVTIYFFNPTDTSLYVDDMKIEFLSLYDKPELRQIEGVLVPFRKN